MLITLLISLSINFCSADLLPEYEEIQGVSMSLYIPKSISVSSVEAKSILSSWTDLVKKLDTLVPVVAYTNVQLESFNLSQTTKINSPASMYIRDWYPLSLSSEKLTPYFSYRQLQEPQKYGDLLKTLGLETLYDNKKPYIEGGNILIGARNDCYFSAQMGDVYTIGIYEGYLNEIGCKKIVRIDPIPLESTGHVDMAIKFINKNTVALGYYKNNNYQSFNRNSFAKDIKNRLSFNVGSLESLLKEIKAKYFYKQEHMLEEINLSNFHIRNEKLLSSLGYKVILVENPPPVIIFELETDQKTIASLYPIHPSYLNGLIVNNTYFFPSYPTFSKLLAEEKVKNIFRSYFQDINSIDAEPFILGGGAVHCITAEIH